MIRRELLILACLLIAAGCNGNKKICDHARGLMIKDIERDREIDKDLAPPDQRASADELADKRVAAVQTHFVEKCMELDDKGISCMKRIDDVRTIEKEAMQRAEVCFQKEDQKQSEACIDTLRKETDERLAGCDDVIDDLMDQIDPEQQK